MSEERNNLAFSLTLIYGILAFIIFFMLVIFSFTIDFAEFNNNGEITNGEDYWRSTDRLGIMSIFVQLLIGLSIGYAGLMYYLKNNPKGLN